MFQDIASDSLPLSCLEIVAKLKKYRTGDLRHPGDRKESLAVCPGVQSPVENYRHEVSREHLLG